MAGPMKTTVFLDVTPYSLVGIYRCSGRTCCLHLQRRREMEESFTQKTDTGGSSKMLVNNYITQHHIQEDSSNTKYFLKKIKINENIYKTFLLLELVNKNEAYSLSQMMTVLVKGWKQL
jgi:hypothetical protein